MSDQFHVFGTAVRKRFEEMTAGDLYVVASDRDKIWETYLAGFPAGSDPFFRKKTEHDCACCRHFIRAVGNVVTIKNSILGTVWDITGLPHPYQAVADAMANYIRDCEVQDVYLTQFKQAGQEKSIEVKDGVTFTWSHFSATVPSKFISANPGEKQGELRTSFEVLKKCLAEITPEAVGTVLNLIDDNAIYRGAEHRAKVAEFHSLQCNVEGKGDLAIWENVRSFAARIKNDAIGTLLVDLSANIDNVEGAVKSFEAKVAPGNYQRPTALITTKMKENAMKLINELGIEPALARRHARIEDVSVGSVLWVDSSVRGKMKGGLDSLISEEVKPAKFDVEKANPITIDAFLKLTHKKGVQLYLANTLLPNLVSLTAPVEPDAKPLFKWDNNFAWSYEGNVADSIKEKVKKAGGQVEGVALRASLAWFNTDDLDLHCIDPTGRELYYGNAKPHILDVDMNIGGESRTPVENMRWQKPADGLYKFMVNNYRRREPVDVGFTLEVESALGLHTFQHPKSVADKQKVTVCTVQVKNGRVIAIEAAPGIISGQLSQNAWGLKTLDLVKVQTIIQSPNYWDGKAVGNKHWFFILEGCKNPLPCRGIYNEFLHSQFATHRKVFEIVGAKTMCPVAEEQLSGVGFSSTRNEKVIVTSGGVPYEISF